jgi:hypothetical protein
VVLLRRDWEFLFDQLKSTHAVAGYLQRVAGEQLELGEEPLRYYDLAQDDAAAAPSEFPPELKTPAHQLLSGPMLPLAPVAAEDRPAHQLFRTILEDLATTQLAQASESHRLRMLGELDRLPVAQRAHVGRYLLAAMEELGGYEGEGLVWRLRTVLGEAGRTHLGFGVCSHPYNGGVHQGLSLWAQLRHHDVLAATNAEAGLTTVAVLLTPCTQGSRPWDTSVVAVSGPTNFTGTELSQLREIWPSPTAA